MYKRQATSLLAARRGDADLAVGNVVGSNIFNLLFVLGVAASVEPMTVPARGPAALIISLLLAIVLLVVCLRGAQRLSRAAGVFLLTLFFAYFGWVLAG